MLGSSPIEKQIQTLLGDGNYKHIFKKHTGLNKEEANSHLSCPTQTELCKLGVFIFSFRALNFGVALCGFHVYSIQAAAASEKHL